MYNFGKFLFFFDTKEEFPEINFEKFLELDELLIKDNIFYEQLKNTTLEINDEKLYLLENNFDTFIFKGLTQELVLIKSQNFYFVSYFNENKKKKFFKYITN